MDKIIALILTVVLTGVLVLGATAIASLNDGRVLAAVVALQGAQK